MEEERGKRKEEGGKRKKKRRIREGDPPYDFSYFIVRREIRRKAHAQKWRAAWLRGSRSRQVPAVEVGGAAVVVVGGLASGGRWE